MTSNPTSTPNPGAPTVAALPLGPSESIMVLITFGTPVQSTPKSTPNGGQILQICDTTSGSEPRIACVAPRDFARARRAGLRSIAITVLALRIEEAAIMAAIPTEPAPKIAIVASEEGGMLRVLRTAPAPVCMPQPKGA